MGLKVNLSENEAGSQVREVLPSGKYLCNIVKVEDKTVQPGSMNAGKPYWNIRFVVQEGKYEGYSIYARIMLFEGKDGTLNSLAQLLRACGFYVAPGALDVPENDQIEGKTLIVKGTKIPAGFNKKLEREVNEQFKVDGFLVAKTETKTGDSSLLP